MEIHYFILLFNKDNQFSYASIEEYWHMKIDYPP